MDGRTETPCDVSNLTPRMGYGYLFFFALFCNNLITRFVVNFTSHDSPFSLVSETVRHFVLALKRREKERDKFGKK